MSDVSVLTASIPERGGMLAEAVASVSSQTLKPTVHLVAVDQVKLGAPEVYNQLARCVTTEWMTFLDDDDLMDTNHLETLMSGVADDVDVVYTGCRCTGPHSYEGYNQPFDETLLETSSIIPITALVRTELYNKVEGMRTEWGYDWRLWQRIVEAGASVKRLDAVTWTYRYRVTPDHKHQSYGEI